MSRQATWKRVQRLIEIGALVPEGVGRGRRYLAGSGVLEAPTPPVGTTCSGGFWTALTDAVPTLSYVSVHLHPSAPMRKVDAEAIFWGVPYGNHVILDFERVERIGAAFAREAFFGADRSTERVVAINASPRVQRVLARVYRTEHIRPASSTADGNGSGLAKLWEEQGASSAPPAVRE